MSSLGVSGCDMSLPCFNNPQSEIFSEKMTRKGFGDSQMNYLDFSKTTMHNSMFPIFTSPARSGSISSGQPVTQNNTQSTSPLMEDQQLNSTKGTSSFRTSLSFTKEQANTPEESQLASKFSMSSSTSSLSFGVQPPAGQTSTVSFSSTPAKQNTQYSSPSLQTSDFTKSSPPKSVVITSEAKLPFTFSPNAVRQAVPTPQTKSVTATTTSTNTLPFTFPASTNTQVASLLTPRSFGFSVVSPPVTTSSPLQLLSTNAGTTPSFTSAVTTSSPSVPFTFTSNFSKIEPTNSLQSSSIAPLNPLASLNSLVSGIETLKPITQATTPKEPAVLNDAVSSTPPQAAVGQPFSFQIPHSSEKKLGKEEGSTSLTKNIFSLPLGKKQEFTESENAVSTQQKTEVQSNFGGSLKNFSFGLGSQKPVFGNTPPSTPPKAVISLNTETNKSDQTPTNMFSFQKTPSTSAFSVATFGGTTQKTFFGGITPSSTSSDAPKPLETLADPLNTVDSTADDLSTSPVIEVNLSPSKGPDDTKTCLEKLSAATNVTVTKIDPTDKKKVESTKPEADSISSSFFSSFSLSSSSSPIKPSQSIFGGSSPSKPSVVYEIAHPEPKSSEEEQKGEKKLVTTEEHQASPKPQTLLSDASTTKATTLFSFSIANLQSSPSVENTQPTSSGLSFGMKLPSSTSVSTSNSEVSGEQTASTFSFAQATTIASTTQSASTAFSFAIATAPSTASSAFGFGSLSPFSENKPKTEFSFGQQAQTTASTPSSIFGGVTSKPTDNSMFGGSTTGENQNAFGQVAASPPENKSVFSQPLSTDPNTQKGFSFSLSSATTTSSQPSLFGTQTTTAASFFGQPICSPTTTASSPFGQPNSTPTVFGSGTSTPFGGTSGFGSKPAFGQSGGSFFGQSRYVYVVVSFHKYFKINVHQTFIVKPIKIT